MAQLYSSCQRKIYGRRGFRDIYKRSRVFIQSFRLAGTLSERSHGPTMRLQSATDGYQASKRIRHVHVSSRSCPSSSALRYPTARQGTPRPNCAESEQAGSEAKAEAPLYEALCLG